MPKTKQISQEAILKDIKLSIPCKAKGALTGDNFVFNFDYNKLKGQIVVDKDESLKLADVIGKNYTDNQELTQIMIEAMQEIIAEDPKKALRDIPLAFLELAQIQESFDKHLGEIYTNQFIKVFGIKTKDKKAKAEIDEIRRDIFESYKQEKKYLPDLRFENAVMANIEKVDNKVSAKALFESVSGTQAYYELMSQQAEDYCCINARLYNLYRNRDQEAEMKNKEDVQAQ